MDLFIEAMYGVLTPQVVAAMIGGLLGAMISLKIELYGWRLSILFGVGSIIGAGALGEYLSIKYGLSFILMHCGLGVLVGIVGNSGLDAFNLAAPDFTRKVIATSSDGLLAKIKLFTPSKLNKKDE